MPSRTELSYGNYQILAMPSAAGDEKQAATLPDPWALIVLQHLWAQRLAQTYR